MDKDELQSRVISFLRFPLIVGVVFIHAKFFSVPINGVYIDINHFPLTEKAMFFLSNSLFSISVPLFFAISGFLYFKGVEQFNFKIYRKKTCNRIRTLVIPYLIWNTVVIFFFYIAHLLSPEMMSGLNKSVVDYTWQDWFGAYWNKDNINGFEELGTPIALQLWFVRDLFILCICSPLIYFLIKRLGIVLILLIFLINIIEVIPDVTGLNKQAWLFFSLGAYFSIHNHSFLCGSIKLIKVCFIIYLFTLITYFVTEDLFKDLYLGYLNILSGVILLVNIVAWGISTQKWSLPQIFVNSSFFIFAYHAIPCLVLTRLSFKLFNPDSDVGLLCVYFVCPIITILSGLLFYYILRKYLPRFTAVITGGR